MTMAIYTVHEPPLRGKEIAPDPERFVFVRDGFHLWAFLLTPLWLLWHRLWLVLVTYVVLAVALDAGLVLLGASPAAIFAVNALLSLLIGFEAASLRRFTLGRRGFANVGVVVGDNIETAEQRFFDSWVKGQPHAIAPVPRPSGTSGVPASVRPAAGSEIIGLFPSPGAPR
jgi:hypothetical protein